MKIEHKKIVDGVLRVTTTDERWYFIDGAYVPSVTWQAGFYPKGVGFYKWLANQKNWDEAEAFKEARGAIGTVAHAAVSDLLKGKTVAHNAKYFDDRVGTEREITLEEYEAVMSFDRWHQRVQPKLLLEDVTVVSTSNGYAGTLDIAFQIGPDIVLTDLKISSSVWPSYELQVSAYQHADYYLDKKGNKLPLPKITKRMILQLGYSRNRDGYKENYVEDKFDLYLVTQKIWANETFGEKPLQKDYPLSITLNQEK